MCTRYVNKGLCLYVLRICHCSVALIIVFVVGCSHVLCLLDRGLWLEVVCRVSLLLGVVEDHGIARVIVFSGLAFDCV